MKWPDLSEISTIDRVLATLLVLTVLLAFGSIYYVIATPQVGDKLTETYIILGPDGKTDGYPIDLNLGERGETVPGIVNHEYSKMNYPIQVNLGNYNQSTIGPFALVNEQQRENPAQFVANSSHDNLKVDFISSKERDIAPYRTLQLWVKVKPDDSQPMRARAQGSNHY